LVPQKYTSAIKLEYDTSEGPTKVDLGENDEDMLPRNGLASWGNPLQWKDAGDDDGSVVLQLSNGSSQRVYLSEGKRDRTTGPVDGAGRPIYDADGDGVEDNVQRTREELDRFYLPNYFFPTEDIYNTQHGNLPGHVRKAEYEGRPNYRSPYFHPELSDGRFRTDAGLESRGDGTYDDVFHQNSLSQVRVPEIHQEADMSLRI
jgi:hypothetical protein